MMLLRQGPRRAWDVLSMKHSALEPKSYGAPILSPFLKQARSAVLCFQCGRLRSDGHVGEAQRDRTTEHIRHIRMEIHTYS